MHQVKVHITRHRTTNGAWGLLAMVFSIGPMAPVGGDPILEERNDANSSSKWLLGTYEYQIAQRIGHDDGLSALIQDQRIGHVPFVFVGQRDYLHQREAVREGAGDADWLLGKGEEELEKSNPRKSYDISNGDLVLLHGRFKTEKIRSVVYPGSKQVAGDRDFDYTYFVAEDDFQKLRRVELAVDALNRSVSIVVPAEKLPVEVSGLEVIVHDGKLRPMTCDITPVKFSPSGPTEIKVDIPSQLDLTFSFVRLTNIPAPAAIGSTCARASSEWLPPFSFDPQWAEAVPRMAVAIEVDPRELMREALENQEQPDE